MENDKFSSINQNQLNEDDIPEDIKDDKPSTMEEDKDKDNEDFVESIIGEQTDVYKFDSFVEKLQEIVIEEQFSKMQMDFFEKYVGEFDDKVENKLIYTSIFNEYTKLTETYIEKNLIERLPQYKIEDFYKMLETRKEQIDDQLLDMLLSFTDFQIFREMMLDYKARKEHKNDLFSGISIQKAKVGLQGKNIDDFDLLNEQFLKNNKDKNIGKVQQQQQGFIKKK